MKTFPVRRANSGKKIERYARILLKEYDEAMEVGDGARSPEEQDAVDRLYRPELAHARGYVQLTNEYFRDTALDQMPDIVKRKLDDVNTRSLPFFPFCSMSHESGAKRQTLRRTSPHQSLFALDVFVRL